ncbi:MAG: response regulator transcription factor [Proteobacteria bacterium]|nr:response regulator transcription factor [Pseudomonadota bacterium]
MHILVVEDDAETRGFVERGLREAGHDVATAASGPEGIDLAACHCFDAIILDRMLPGVDGLGIVEALRARGDMTPVLMLTALGSIADRVDGLNAGADDYLIKPFAFSELAARMAALGRRLSANAGAPRLTVGDIVMDFERRTVHRQGHRIALQPREFLLLGELMRNANRIVTRKMLLEHVWDFDFDPQTNIVESHLSRLRSKLNAGFGEDVIETVRGEGYRFRSA